MIIFGVCASFVKRVIKKICSHTHRQYRSPIYFPRIMKGRARGSRRRINALLLVLFAVLLFMIAAHAGKRPARLSSAHHPTAPKSIKTAFTQSGTDKLTRHGYHRFYDQFLQPLYGKPVRMLEVGVLGGDSLHAWQTVFDAAQSTIYGVSWPPADNVRTGDLHDNVHILYRDQSDCGQLDDIGRTVGQAPLDLVIDDGSHHPEHQLKTLVKLFPLVAPGGFYVIEDTETSYWDAPWSSLYGYKLANVGVGRSGSLVTALKMLVEVINQRYAVRSYHRDFSIIDAKVDPDVAWITFAQNMVILRKKSEEDDPYQAFIGNGADESSWAARAQQLHHGQGQARKRVVSTLLPADEP